MIDSSALQVRWNRRRTTLLLCYCNVTEYLNSPVYLPNLPCRDPVAGSHRSCCHPATLVMDVGCVGEAFQPAAAVWTSCLQKRPIPKGLNHSARGCARRATPGRCTKRNPQTCKVCSTARIRPYSHQAAITGQNPGAYRFLHQKKSAPLPARWARMGGIDRPDV